MRQRPGPDPRPPGGFPDDWNLFDLQDFGGVNSQAARQSIADNEFSWLENFFPIGPGNLRAMWGKGDDAYTASAGRTIVYHYFYVLAGIPYAFVCLDNGTAVQVNLNTMATTTISGTPNTFYNGNIFPSCCQWGNKYLQIVCNVSTNGYFLWDGTVLYSAGTLGPQVNVTNGGVGYTSAPTVTFFGGSGSGAAATATVTNGSVTGITITNPGSGYLVTDGLVQIQISGGGITAKTAIVTANLTGGAVSSLTIVDGGAGYVGIPTVSFVGGGGSGAAATATVVGGVITGFTGLTGGSGYSSAPAVVIAGGSNASATATVSLMPFGVSGTALENYLTRTWIINEDRNTFSAPGDPANFSTSAGGGSYRSFDGFLKTAFKNVKQANSYLYTFADSSINNISNVQTSGSPATTTFNNLNSDPQVGTPWRDSVFPYGLALTLGNSSGFYLMYGGAAQKISEKLDGIMADATLPSTGNGISGACATIFGIKVIMFLVTVLDPFTSILTPKLLIYEANRQKWFLASQEVTLTYITTQEVNSVLTAWGTDGNSLFPLFAQPSTTLLKKAQGKLWTGESYLWNKQFLRIYSQIADLSSEGASVSATIVTERGNSVPIVLGAGGNLTFVNNLGGILNFVNTVGGTLQFTTNGTTISSVNYDSSYGHLMGLNFTSLSGDFTIAALGIAYRNLTALMGAYS